MITKEKLQELIEQGATVYSSSFTIDDMPGDIWLTGDCSIENNILNVMNSRENGSYNIENLYEHKADAEWDLEFENVEKRIKFVKPKPFKKLGKWPTFIYENHGFSMEKGYGGRLYVYYKDNSIYRNAFNEENYTEACRLIKKLFMGEDK